MRAIEPEVYSDDGDWVDSADPGEVEVPVGLWPDGALDVVDDDILANPYDFLRENTFVRAVHDAVAELDARSRQVITWHFGLDGDKPMSYGQVGVLFNRTRQRAEQISNRGIRQLRGNHRLNIWRAEFEVDPVPPPYNGARARRLAVVPVRQEMARRPETLRERLVRVGEYPWHHSTLAITRELVLRVQALIVLEMSRTDAVAALDSYQPIEFVKSMGAMEQRLIEGDIRWSLDHPDYRKGGWSVQDIADRIAEPLPRQDDAATVRELRKIFFDSGLQIQDCMVLLSKVGQVTRAMSVYVEVSRSRQKGA